MSQRVDYDSIAENYPNRYERSDYSGVGRALAAFVGGDGHTPAGRDVLEVGCGTGHWLDFLRRAGASVHGIDSSAGMLRIARTLVPAALLVRGFAEALPVRSERVDRIFCINALHHFTDPSAFFGEARRILRSTGGVWTVGLDPHAARDRWWIYDYFPEALVADRGRYPAASTIRAMLDAAGFERCETREVQRLPRRLPVNEVLAKGFVDRGHTSQLMVIADEEYERGMQNIRAAAARDPELVLEADLTLYGTVGWVA